MKHKNLYALTCSRFFSSYSENVIHFLLPVMIYKAYGSIHDAGLVVVLHVASRLVGYPLSGVICDQVGEKKVLVLSSFLRSAVCFLSFSLLTFYVKDSKSVLFIVLNLLALVDGFSGGVAQIAFESIGPKFFPKEQFGTFQASVQSAQQGAFLLAPVSGAFLLDSLGQALLLGLLSVFFLVSALVVRTDSVAVNRAERTRVFHQAPFSFSLLFSSLSVILKDQIILITLVLTLLDNLLLGLYGAMSTPLGLGLFQQTDQSLGWMVTLSYFVSLITISFSHWIHSRKSTLWLLSFSYLISYLGFFILGVASHFLIFAFALILIESSCAAGVFALRIVRAQYIPGRDFGKISGILTLLQQLTLPIGGLMVASVSEPQNLQTLILVCSFILGGITLWLFLRLAQRMRSHQVMGFSVSRL